MARDPTLNVTLNGTNTGMPPFDLKLIGTVFFSLICILGTVGNLLVILTVVRWPVMRTPCNLLIANISFVDLVVSLVMAPLRILDALSVGWVLGKVLCYVVAPLQDALVTVSAVTHTVVAIERYRAILMPFKARLNKRKVKLALVLIWIGCYLGASLPLVFFVKYERQGDIMICVAGLLPEEHFYIFALYLVLAFMILPLLLQTISYLMIIRFLRRKDEVQSCQEASVATTQLQHVATRQRVKRKRRLIKMLISLMIIFQVCFIPRGAIMLIYEWGPTLVAHPAFPYIKLATMLLFYVKHIINPLLLYCMSQDFKTGLVAMVTCRTPKGVSSNGT